MTHSALMPFPRRSRLTPLPSEKRNRGRAQVGTFFFVVLTLLTPSGAHANDDAQGRLRGDIAPSLEAGLAASDTLRATASLRALYLATAGVYATAEGLADQSKLHAVSVGVEMRPLFWARFLRNLEQGPSFLDVAVDSFSLSLGARFSPTHTQASESSKQVGIEIGVGIELPLLGRYDGPYLSSHAFYLIAPDRLAGLGQSTGEPSALVLLTLGWRLAVQTHIVDAHDLMPQ